MMALRLGILWKWREVVLLLVTLSIDVASERNGMVSRDFRGIPSIQEVECWGGYLEADAKVFSLTLFKISDNRILSNVNHLTNQCVTYGDFSSCTIDSGNTRNSRIRILVTDMAEEEARKYGCNVTSFKLVGEIPRAVTWSITVTRPKTTTTTVSTTTSTTTTTQPPASRNVNGRPVASGVQGELHDFYLPPVVLVIGLILIIVLALLSLVLIVLQCHKAGRRKKRNRAANRESLLSAKSEIAGCSTGSKDLDLGVTTYRATRSFPSFAPGPQQGPMPVGPPAHFAMRYQKGPPDDTGYVSGSSNHYSEPYGCHEDGTQDRTRPTSRPGLPQVKGSPQPPRLPDNHP